MLNVLTAADNYLLAMHGETKTFLGRTDSAQDSNIALQLRSASEAIMAHCGRTFHTETVEEILRFPARQTGQITLERWPVQSLVSIVEDEVTLVATDYELDFRSGLLTRLSGNTPIAWGSHVVVTYSAGYVQIPAGVKEATMLLVKAMQESLERDVGVKSERFEGVAQVSFFSASPDALPPEVVGRLGGFKDSPL